MKYIVIKLTFAKRSIDQNYALTLKEMHYNRHIFGLLFWLCLIAMKRKINFPSGETMNPWSKQFTSTHVFTEMVYLHIVNWEPEGRYCRSKMFHWEPEGRYCHWLCTAIAPFWLSTDDMRSPYGLGHTFTQSCPVRATHGHFCEMELDEATSLHLHGLHGNYGVYVAVTGSTWGLWEDCQIHPITATHYSAAAS